VKRVNKSIIGVGIDQGIANCGFSVVELTPNDDIHVLTSGTIKTSSDEELSSRIQHIYHTINQLAKEYNTSILGCERLFYNSEEKSEENKKRRNKSASIVYTNMVTGILYLIAGENNMIIQEFVPGTVKKYVAGKGNASKEEVADNLQKILGIDKKFKTNHEADAIAIGITAVKYYKELEIKKMKTNKKITEKGEITA
jgi:crossover junction endodeoxyribonuclease RuvC